MSNAMTAGDSPAGATFLLVDDDEVDALAFRRILSKARISNAVVRAKDGQQALELLRDRSSAESLSEPLVLILDLNMPRMGGFELLDILRADPELAKTMVYVVSTSNREADRREAMARGAVGFLDKSESLERLVDMFRANDTIREAIIEAR